mgnify:CR=1 FL=1
MKKTSKKIKTGIAILAFVISTISFVPQVQADMCGDGYVPNYKDQVCEPDPNRKVVWGAFCLFTLGLGCGLPQ